MRKILALIVLISFFAVNSAMAASKSHSGSHSDDKDIKTEHLVEATLLFDEIYDIDISEGHYRVSVEILMAWEGETEKFLNKFGDAIIHGSKMEEFMAYDPWQNITTRNGIKGDLIISALQKSIRRGMTEEAISFGFEMYITSSQFEDKLWRRLQAISVEDVGFGDLNSPIIINTLNQMRQNFPYNDGDRPLFFVHAIRYLAAAKKDRTSDHMKNIVINEFRYGKKPVIPDFAIDMHTEEGRKLGRDFKHFLTVASQTNNNLEVNEDFKEKLLTLLQKIEDDDQEEVANQFRFNTWQQ